MPTAVTDGIRVTVESFYLADRSDPDEQAFAFAYVVTIANEGDTPVQLRRRHWIITDGNAAVREVEGPGVVGEEPVIAPGAAHRYTSGAVLPTPVGTMEGSYEMHRLGGGVFRAAIPRFPLQRPGVLH
jgi:ApaG protein